MNKTVVQKNNDRIFEHNELAFGKLYTIELCLNEENLGCIVTLAHNITTGQNVLVSVGNIHPENNADCRVWTSFWSTKFKLFSGSILLENEAK